ncbi:MAG: polyprenyl synthetase family protein [Desulfonauticus sp.]|nr:polyprenyl synthetase family protein [Desulfonauticus sp.]
MKSNQFKADLKAWANLINTHLKRILEGLNAPLGLKQSMAYSLLAGGKRIRPILCLNWAQMLGLNKEKILNFACALEFIHTYSLIHDDLPAMDDDDFRRGKPSNHKVYGEAMAILAGDALLTYSFELMLDNPIPCSFLLKASRIVSKAAGASGMVGGQVLDLELENKDSVNLEQVQTMHRLKTGALIEVSCLSGAILAQEVGASNKDLDKAKNYGQNIGLAFQIIDDILDVIGDEKKLGKPIGSDIKQGKSTYPTLIGLEQSYDLAQQSINQALECLDDYRGQEKDFLQNLAQYIITRAH